MFRCLPALLLGLALATACSKSPSPGPERAAGEREGDAAPKPVDSAAVVNASLSSDDDRRPKLACAALLGSLGRSSNASLDVPPVAGSWGKVPPELQVVPPGAEHCGSIAAMGKAVFASSLRGKALEDFYAPLFAKIGCEPLSCREAQSGSMSQTQCSCEKGYYLHGTLTTEPGSAAYLVGVRDMREH